MRRQGLAKRIALKHLGVWLLAAIAVAAIYRFVAREPMDIPVAIALGLGLFVVSPFVYLLARQYEQLEE